MKRTQLFIVITAVLAFVSIGHTVRAITVAAIPTDQIGNAVNNATTKEDLTAPLFDLAANGTLTDLATTATSDGSAIHIGDVIYVTNSQGFQKQTVGASTATTIRSGSALEMKDRMNNKIIVSNSKKSGKGSFVYTATTGAIKNFSPTVREIKAASFAEDGTALAMIAKNGEGKQKVFLSGASLMKVVEHPLPKYATSCSGIVLSPNKKMVFVGCTFNVPNKTKGQRGYAMLAIGKSGKITEKRSVKNQTIQYASWLSDTHLVTVESVSGGYNTFYDNTVGANTIASTKSIGGAYTTEINSQSVFAIPFQVIRNSSTKFWYSYLYVNLSDASLMGTFLGLYDIAASVDSLLLNDGTFTYFTDMQ